MNIVKSDINKWRVSIALTILFICLIVGIACFPLKVNSSVQDEIEIWVDKSNLKQ